MLLPDSSATNRLSSLQIRQDPHDGHCPPIFLLHFTDLIPIIVIGIDHLCDQSFHTIGFFHQSVLPAFADGYAKITGKTKFDFTAAQALTGCGVDLQDFLPDALIFLFSGRWLPVYVAVIGAAVDVEYPAKNGDTVLAGKRPDSF